jgi:hypothetical protein
VQPREVPPGTGLAIDPGMATTPSAMTSGDCLVVQRTDGLFAVYKVRANGARLPVKNHIPNRREAWQIARSLLAPDGEGVYFKEVGEPDSTIRPHPDREE